MRRRATVFKSCKLAAMATHVCAGERPRSVSRSRMLPGAAAAVVHAQKTLAERVRARGGGLRS
jgi:hypothetical protein